MGPRKSVNSCSLAEMSLLNVDNRNKQLRFNHVFIILITNALYICMKILLMSNLLTLIPLGQICTILVYQNLWEGKYDFLLLCNQGLE